MKVILWGFSAPKFIETVALEMRSAVPSASMFVQISESARSAEYCGIQPEEFLRVCANDFSQLEGLVSRMAKNDGVLVLDIWSLLLLPDFSQFLSGIFRFCHKLKSVVFLAPETWAGVWRREFHERAFDDERTQAALFSRVLAMTETVFNEHGSFVLLQSPPSLDHLSYFSGQPALLEKRMLGLVRAPKLMLSNRALVCSGVCLAKQLAKVVEGLFHGKPCEWLQEVEPDVDLSPDRFLHTDEKEWAAFSKLTQVPMSWDGYCAQSAFRSVRFPEENIVMKVSSLVAWMYFVGVIKYQSIHGVAKRRSVEAAFAGI